MTKTRRRKTCGVCVARKDIFFFSTKIPHIKYTNKKRKELKEMEEQILTQRMARAKRLQRIFNPASSLYFRFSLSFVILKIGNFDFTNFRRQIFVIAYAVYAALMLLLPLCVDDERFQENWLNPICFQALLVGMLIQTTELGLIIFSIL